MGFKEVAPGVLVKVNFKVTYPHPDPVWVIQSIADRSALSDGQGHLAVFSNEEKAENMLSDNLKNKYHLKKYTWDEAVDNYGREVGEAIVDLDGGEGFYSLVPLKKNI